MTKYRIHVSFDEINFFWVVMDNGMLIANPTKEDLYGTKLKKYNKTNICDRCREENKITDNSILYSGNARTELDKGGNWTGKWDCPRCWQDFDPNSQDNLIKSVRDRRTGNLHNPDQIFADNCEELTSKVFGVERLAVKYDKYSKLPYDHPAIAGHISVMIGDKLVDLYGKVPQTKGASLLIRRQGILESEYWHSSLKNEHNKEFDVLMFYCVSKDGKLLERIYIFPSWEIINMTGIVIHKNPTRISGRRFNRWYELYRIVDEEFLNRVNEAWKKII